MPTIQQERKGRYARLYCVIALFWWRHKQHNAWCGSSETNERMKVTGCARWGRYSTFCANRSQFAFSAAFRRPFCFFPFTFIDFRLYFSCALPFSPAHASSSFASIFTLTSAAVVIALTFRFDFVSLRAQFRWRKRIYRADFLLAIVCLTSNNAWNCFNSFCWFWRKSNQLEKRSVKCI